jgi:hypothetical protein
MSFILILREELLNDPLGRAYASMDEIEVIHSLMEVNRDAIFPIKSDNLLAWSAMNGRFMKIKNLAEDDAQSDELRSIAWASMKMIERDETDLDLSLPDRAVMLDTLVSVGTLDQSDKDDLYTMATRTISRAEELNVPLPLQRNDIERARV